MRDASTIAQPARFHEAKYSALDSGIEYLCTFVNFDVSSDPVGFGATRYDAFINLLMRVELAPVTR